MNSQRANRRISIAVAGTRGNRPLENSAQASMRRRQTIAPNLKENPNQANALESTKDVESSNAAVDLPGFANAMHRSSVTHGDRSSSTSLNESYVSSSSSDQSTDRLNLSEISDTIPEINKQLPSRPPLADRRRQTMMVAPAAKKRESLAEMRRERRKSMAPRIAQTIEIAAAGGNQGPSKSLQNNDDEDITGKLSLPTQAIQDIMHQTSKQTEDDHSFDNDPPRRQSLPFDDEMEDPPKIQRTTPTVTAGRRSNATPDTDIQALNDFCGLDTSNGSDQLDKTANEYDLKMLFGFGEETGRVETLDSPMEGVNDDSQQDTTESSRSNDVLTQETEASLGTKSSQKGATSSQGNNALEHEESKENAEEALATERTPSPRNTTAQSIYQSPPRNETVNAMQDSPARNTRSAKKPLVEPLGISPGRRLRKSPARTKRDSYTSHVSRELPSSDSSKSPSTESVDPDKDPTQQSQENSAPNDPENETELQRKTSSLPPPTSKSSSLQSKGRAKSMTPVTTTTLHFQNVPGSKTNETVNVAGAKAIEKTTEKDNSRHETETLAPELRLRTSLFPSSSMDTSASDLIETSNEIDSTAVPLPTTMLEAIGEVHPRERDQFDRNQDALPHPDFETPIGTDHGPMNAKDSFLREKAARLLDTDENMDTEQTKGLTLGDDDGGGSSYQPKIAFGANQTTTMSEERNQKDDTADSNMDLNLSAELDDEDCEGSKMKYSLQHEENVNKLLHSAQRLSGFNNQELSPTDESRNASIRIDHPSESFGTGKHLKEHQIDGTEDITEELPYKNVQKTNRFATSFERNESLRSVIVRGSNSRIHLDSVRHLDSSNCTPLTVFANSMRHPPRSSITPTKLTGAPTRLANPLTAPLSEFKRKQSMTPSKNVFSLKRNATFDHVHSGGKRPKTTSGLKSALRSKKSNSKTTKMVNFGSEEVLRFDPNQAMLTPVRDANISSYPDEDIRHRTLGKNAGGTPFRSKDEASINLSDRLRDEDDSTDSESTAQNEPTAVLELNMNQCLDLDNNMLGVDISGSSGSSMDTTVDSPENSSVCSIVRSPNSPRMAEHTVEYNMIPNGSFEAAKFDCVADESRILADENPAATASVDLKNGELIDDEIRKAAAQSRANDVLSTFVREARVFSDVQSVHSLLSNVIEKANESMPLQMDLNLFLPVDDSNGELVRSLQHSIRQGDGVVFQKLRESFGSIQAFERSSWSSWVLTAGQELERVLEDRCQMIDRRVQEVESLAQAIDQQTATILKAYSYLKLKAMENKEVSAVVRESLILTCISVRFLAWKPTLMNLNKGCKDLCSLANSNHKSYDMLREFNSRSRNDWRSSMEYNMKRLDTPTKSARRVYVKWILRQACANGKCDLSQPLVYH